MMAETTNLHLKKPEYADPADIKDINDNMDTIDGAVKQAQDDIDAIEGWQPTGNGTLDQILRSNGDGTTRWDEAATQQEIGSAVTDWLDDNIDQASTAAIDDTLTVEHAAAESKTVGDKLSDIRSALGTVPSGKTAQGQIDELYSIVSDENDNAIYSKDLLEAISDPDGTIIKSYDLQTAIEDEALRTTNLAEDVADNAEDIEDLQNNKVNQPLSGGYPVYGTAGQVLRTKGDGTTEWATVGLPTDEQTQTAVENWLNDHPDATTTVQDWSLTYSKLQKGTLGIITPEMFGAKGDGTTDDTAAFIACFAATGYDSIIYISPKTYLITSQVVVYSNTTVICEGTILDRNDYTAENDYIGLFHAEEETNIKWKGGKIEGSGYLTHYTTDSDVFSFVKCSYILIDGVEIEDIPTVHGIVYVNSHHIETRNVTIKDYTYCGIGYINCCNHTRTINCKVINGHETTANNRYPITVSAYDGNAGDTANVAPYDILVDGCYIEDSAPFWEGIDAHGADTITVTNNKIVGVICGIALVGSAARNVTNYNISNNTVILPTQGTEVEKENYGIVIKYAFTGVVSGNVLKHSGYLTTSTPSGGAVGVVSSDTCIISNNMMYGMRKAGMFISESFNIKVVDNTLYGNSLDASTATAFYFNGEADRILISNNDVRGYGIACRAPRTNITGATRVRLTENEYDRSVGYQYVTNLIPDALSASPGANNMKCGKIGDIVWNTASDGTNELGWICITSGTNLVDAVYKPIYNYEPIIKSKDLTPSALSKKLQQRRDGKVVHLFSQGAMTLTANGSTEICTLDTDYRPVAYVEQDGTSPSGEHYRISITTAGVLSIYNYSSSTTLNARLNMTYFAT